jgi:hypothetical protein
VANVSSSDTSYTIIPIVGVGVVNLIREHDARKMRSLTHRHTMFSGCANLKSHAGVKERDMKRVTPLLAMTCVTTLLSERGTYLLSYEPLVGHHGLV